MHSLAAIDWHAVFAPSVDLIELALRGAVMYLGILLVFRFFRREAGGLSTADLLVVVLVADAAQNAMSSDYHSITEGAVLVGTIVGCNYLFDRLAYHYEWAHKLFEAPPLLLINRGRVLRRNLRAEMITMDDLMSLLRLQGIEDVEEVKQARLESDGQLSVITRKADERGRRSKSTRRVES